MDGGQGCVVVGGMVEWGVFYEKAGDALNRPTQPKAPALRFATTLPPLRAVAAHAAPAGVRAAAAHHPDQQGHRDRDLGALGRAR